MADNEKTALLKKTAAATGNTNTYDDMAENDGFKTANASTLFQLLLYYNILASIVYFFCEGVLLIYRLQTFVYQNSLVVLLNVCMFVLWTVGEVFRLYVGYVGNVKEQVPQRPLGTS